MERGSFTVKNSPTEKAERTKTVAIVIIRPRVLGAISNIALMTKGTIKRENIITCVIKIIFLKRGAKGKNFFL